MSMADRDGYIWYDGKLVPWRSATTHVLTHSLHYGLAVFEGIRVKTTSFARHPVNVSMCRAKYSGTYANSILASQEALDHGYDEGLLLDVDGFVAEGAGENLFIVKNGCIYEPELTSALMGITRDSVIALAADLGYTVTPRRVTRDDLYIADEAFFTGTAAEVTPIREVDGRKIGAGRRGPVTRKLQKAFFEVVNGRDQRHSNWLAPVAKGKPITAAGKPKAAAGKPKAARSTAAAGKPKPAAATPARKGKR